jgi:hypothetical protein
MMRSWTWFGKTIERNFRETPKLHRSAGNSIALAICSRISTGRSLMDMATSDRLGLGLRQPVPSYGQGPSISALAQQQQMQYFVPAQISKQTTLFIGSISGGITDAFLNQLLSVSYPSRSKERYPTTNGRHVAPSILSNDSLLLRTSLRASALRSLWNRKGRYALSSS